ncbi:hypothetical protein DPEC_G00057760 [Dallia pectoralis]|uniref:Uncharacterized protein n=1 Tax=Dallia pectoralis TaxID=75939 RepID=A0ACC2H5X8_DALPE|nr:hypothetical protein DPEC_G00057760 [Dallia pectoralis]
MPNSRQSSTVRGRVLMPVNQDSIEESPSKEPKLGGFSNRERFRTAFRMKAYAIRQGSEDAGALQDPEERGFPADILLEEMIPTLKLVIRAVRIMRFLLNKKKFKETLRPYDVKDVIEQYSAGHLDMLCRIKYLQTRIDMILTPGSTLTPKHKKNQNKQPTPFAFSTQQSPRHESYLAKASMPDADIDQSMMGRFVRVERQVEDMEKKLDFLVDMHIQHVEHLQVDSAGAAHMTIEPLDPLAADPLCLSEGKAGGGGGGGYAEIRRVFFNYAEACPQMSYQVPVSKVTPYYSYYKEPGATARRGGGVPGPGHAPPTHHAPMPTYTERPTVLPISSLQDTRSTERDGAHAERLALGPGRTTGRGVAADLSPLSMLSVDHEELERSPSGFSISGEREDLGDPNLGTSGGSGGLRDRRHLAEGETDTDTDPFTPSGGGGQLPLSSTGEGFPETVWNTLP